MRVGDRKYTTIWVKPDDPSVIQIINQQTLPFRFEVMDLKRTEDFVTAIRDMYVRGAGLIGATAGYGMYIAALNAPRERFDSALAEAGRKLVATRPTAKNLEWAVKRQLQTIGGCRSIDEKIAAAFDTARAIAAEDADYCRRIGEHGLSLIERISRGKKGPVNVLTHCNAGWLAFVDYGSALAPVYAAFERGIDIHVWVDETRPRNQGARLTAWELAMHGVPHHLIADNAGGHLMQHGMVDLVIVGADRVTRTGDAANKIGTYLKALAAFDNSVPFYVAFPSSTFDWELSDGVGGIPIEERDENEVLFMSGLPGADNENAGRTDEKAAAEVSVRICPRETPAKNYGFDVTPARLISGLITERGICAANEEAIQSMYRDREGYVKFSATVNERRLVSLSSYRSQLDELNRVRSELYARKLIGMYETGIGFGNISMRPSSTSAMKTAGPFVISGSGTGGKAELSAEDYCEVLSFDLETNSVVYNGLIPPSSETMSHGAVYRSMPQVRCVIHIHHLPMFVYMLEHGYSRTPEDAAFGTPRLAEEIARCVHEGTKTDGFIVMAGHREGIIVYGSELEETFERLAALYDEVVKK